MDALLERWRVALATAELPPYLAIVAVIADELNRGLLLEDQCLPTVRDVTRALSLSTNTVDRAWTVGKKLGLIYFASEERQWRAAVPQGGVPNQFEVEPIEGRHDVVDARAAAPVCTIAVRSVFELANADKMLLLWSVEELQRRERLQKGGAQCVRRSSDGARRTYTGVSYPMDRLAQTDEQSWN
ncbi:hypothetical protein [uncultured Pseudacidovorax sp.]|uniref:hypothetical protein n=1 Tax=uncultured Pseudacidovorax sp. TaxID=679313 RepID=UPI0025DA43CF|nr:hypothetical protein [uncultured Pseudacidovorax sp.]